MGQWQLRGGLGQTRYMILVMMAYRQLKRQLKQARARDWTFDSLTTIGASSRAMLREILFDTLAWATDQIVNKSCKHKLVIARLELP